MQIRASRPRRGWLLLAALLPLLCLAGCAGRATRSPTPVPPTATVARQDATLIPPPAEPQTAAPTESKAEVASEPEVLTVTVTGSVVNVRAGPSLHHAILGQVRQGDALPVTGISEDREWLQVAPDGASLWIFADLTDAAAQRRVLPVVQASACPAQGPSPSLACDKEILLSIRDTLTDDRPERLPTWQPEVPLHNFTGVAVGGEPPRVLALNLNGRSLGGGIPPALVRLDHLQRLHLRGTNLRGLIPLELAWLSQLVELDLGDNLLHGAIPPELGQLAQLQALSLSYNELSGPLPPELGQLAQLQELWLHDNQLTGPLPPELGQLSQLKYLYLYDNHLSGPLPPELGQLAQLHVLSLGNNQLSGPLPPELGQLGQLQYLALWNNQLTGPLSPELQILATLKVLFLSHNQLTGPVPPELGQLPILEQLYLNHNQLTGPVPPELGQLWLETLHLDGNALTGCLPAAWQDRFTVTTRTSGEPLPLPYCPD